MKELLLQNILVATLNNSTLLQTLNLNLNNMAQDVTKLQTLVSDLSASVTNESASIDKAVSLIGNFGATLATLQEQLADAVSQAVDPATLQQIEDALTAAKTAIDAKNADLAKAVTDATPAT
jgi:chromosome segregation ATPase